MLNDDERTRTKLAEAHQENSKLRDENARLKSILSSFSVKSGADLVLPPVKEQDAVQPSKTEPPSRQQAAQAIATERIRLFRALFRGREDVYAVRWESKKGKSGYSPACEYEWDPLICKKPRSKCMNCSYLPLTDDVMRSHLRGQKTIGIYPILKDETCWFLAADFDKADCQDDARAFMHASRAMGVPAYLERSRSGKGAHAWIFFELAVPATLARKLGSAILTAAMEKRHQVGLASYDRLFPNQDTLPKGGFGNLIALPLQRGPREKGNSVFVADDFDPHTDQWGYLGSVQRLRPDTLVDIVREAERRDLIIGVHLPIIDESLEKDPWTLLPSRSRSEPAITGPMPKLLTVVRSNLLYLEKAKLSPALTNRIVRLAAFQNPEFYAAQAMRLSTFGKPRVIGCAEEFSNHIGIPRGCVSNLRSFLDGHGIGIEEKDERYSGKRADFTFHGSLTPEQKVAADQLLKYEDGVIVAPPGFGKTVLAAWAIAQRNVNTLVLVHRTTLLEQWRAQLSLFLNISEDAIGTIGSGRNKMKGILDIAMLQSLQRKGEVADLVADYGFVIADECHHMSAFTFERIMKEVKAKYVLGLTATPTRKDGHHPIIFMQCGPIRHRIHARQASVQRPFTHIVIPRETAFALDIADPSIHEIFAKMVLDRHRNLQIVEDIVTSVGSGFTPLVLTERIEHVETLESMVKEKIDDVAVLKGGMKRIERDKLRKRLSVDNDRTPRVIIATGRYIGEGFDYSRLDTLFLAMPISWRGTLEQYVGRLHRLHEGKREVRVYDYVDRNIPMLARMYAKRVRGYYAMGYSLQESNGQFKFSSLIQQI
jgi:superfamily II DNA or RNA helicase